MQGFKDEMKKKKLGENIGDEDNKENQVDYLK